MLDRLSDLISQYKRQVDYCEIRLEESEGTKIRFRGKDIESVSQPLSRGGCVRALYKGRCGFVSFNDLDGLKDKIEEAISLAKLGRGEKVKFGEVEPVVDQVLVSYQRDPREVPLAEKVALFDHYLQQIWKISPKVSDAALGYFDGNTQVILVSSGGVCVVQEFADIYAGFTIIARKGEIVQEAFLTVADPFDYRIVLDLDDQISERGEMALKLLEAEPVAGGNYPVVINQELAGSFIHEAFGHLSEADHVYENENLRKMMKIGKLIAVKGLNVVDDPTLVGGRGSYQYDAEGVLAKKTYLIKDGILAGRLHSRETAGKMGEELTGNARVASYRSRPLVRMSNTYVDSGSVPFSEMIKDIKLGVYAIGSAGGTTDREMFTFTAKWGYMIRDGELAELVRDVKLSGNLFETLKNIEAIGNDLEIGKRASLCGKGGQYIPVSSGGPHLKIRSVVVGGQ